jgi:AcrR family transcriptional regulator
LENNTKNLIKYVSFKYFLEKGYEASNIRDICKEVGIKGSTLYFHYKSKEDLFFSIFDEINSNQINFIQQIEELKQDISPELKLYAIFKKKIDFYTHNLANQKFVLRYYLFPEENIIGTLKDKFRYWTGLNNKIILDILEQCMDKKLLRNNRSASDYLEGYKKFERFHLNEMIVTGIKMIDKEIDKEWNYFWKTTMLS